MSERIDTSLVISALEMAVHNRQPEPGVIHHSDQGRQYTALAFGRHLEKSGVLGSMGRVGSAHDNAMAERCSRQQLSVHACQSKEDRHE